MKKITLALITIIATMSFAHAGRKVDNKYCDKMVEDVTVELQSQVNRGVRSVSKANLIVTLVNNTCRAAITDGLTKKEYESLFETVKASDCNGIADDVDAAMSNYTADSRRVVSNKIISMCSNAAITGDSVLMLMYNVDQYLKDIGVR